MNHYSNLFLIKKKGGDVEELIPVFPSQLKIKEKKIEEWIATNPKLLFSDQESVKIIAQEITGSPEADLLAVDSQGILYIIEIKRNWGDRGTVGQILDYATHLSNWDYDTFNQRWRKFASNEESDLFEEFKKWTENSSFNKEDFLKERRLYILASEADEGLKRILGWLREKYNVPIDFIPFTVHEYYENEVLLQIQRIEVEPLVIRGGWAGDWFFNANQTYAPGAYKLMLKQSVLSAYGYGKLKTKSKMDKPAQGDRVFVYLNSYGIIAVGTIEDEEAYQSDSIYNTKNHDEYQRKVKWIAKVKIDDAVTTEESSNWGYNLPVRCTLCKFGSSKVSEIIANELIKRAK